MCGAAATAQACLLPGQILTTSRKLILGSTIVDFQGLNLAQKPQHFQERFGLMAAQSPAARNAELLCCDMPPGILFPIDGAELLGKPSTQSRCISTLGL